ncbi:GAF and ANTAR domain-containing protein [Nocardioides iriomotensis]|uniref:ANTAR domain-containing protein n=1 Tax=Nocardioides iriomotensis TaxID=715784 RepID=A0A4Q5J033_9ACTN|nr:GAF and ANTAR domain-containing protein [Nocardioides iriomotensis]RYU10711.1 ANTAR domain-containing protein [Nocardioides iriomotensis]
MNGTPVPVLDRLLSSCCKEAGLDGAGVSIVSSSGAHEPLYGSDHVAEAIERLQVTLGEGPCIDASATGTPVLVADLTDPRDAVAGRWPVFRDEATLAGARAIFAFPLRIGAISLGAVDLYRHTAGPLSRKELGSAYSSMEKVGLAVLETPDYYGDVDAPTTINMTVHQAAGMVMGQLDSSIDEAMVRLRAAAFAEGLSVNELAVEVVDGRRRFLKETR